MKTKEYVRPMPANWFMHNRHLQLFMLRELSAFFVAGYSVFLLVMLYKAGQGEQAFQQFFEGVMKSGLSIFLHLIALAFVVYHALTSFNAAPVIMDVRIGEDPIDPRLLIAAHYVMWVVVSVVILIVAL
ncbi:MAG: fumarate reductase subunit C [Gemmatales bacterium]|nr:MAG: fumarate reductase subunit C [Gemmatales bacterium]